MSVFIRWVSNVASSPMVSVSRSFPRFSAIWLCFSSNLVVFTPSQKKPYHEIVLVLKNHTFSGDLPTSSVSNTHSLILQSQYIAHIKHLDINEQRSFNSQNKHYPFYSLYFRRARSRSPKATQSWIPKPWHIYRGARNHHHGHYLIPWATTRVQVSQNYARGQSNVREKLQ